MRILCSHGRRKGKEGSKKVTQFGRMLISSQLRTCADGHELVESDSTVMVFVDALKNKLNLLCMITRSFFCWLHICFICLWSQHFIQRLQDSHTEQEEDEGKKNDECFWMQWKKKLSTYVYNAPHLIRIYRPVIIYIVPARRSHRHTRTLYWEEARFSLALVVSTYILNAHFNLACASVPAVEKQTKWLNQHSLDHMLSLSLSTHPLWFRLPGETLWSLSSRCYLEKRTRRRKNNRSSQL